MKTIPYLICACLLLIPGKGLRSQSFRNNWQGSRAGGMAGASLTVSDAFSAVNNLASAAFLRQSEIGIAGNQPFLLNGVNNFLLGAVLPVGAGAFGLSLAQFGDRLYREQMIGLGYTRQLAPGLAIGVQFDYLSYAVEEYGREGGLTFDLGLYYALSERVQLAAHVFNPPASRLSQSSTPLPVLFRSGIRYVSSEKLFFIAEAVKDLDHPLRLIFGMEYRPLPEICLRAGSGTEAATLGFGAGFRWNAFWLDVASEWHPVLGLTPHAGIRYQMKKKR